MSDTKQPSPTTMHGGTDLSDIAMLFKPGPGGVPQLDPGVQRYLDTMSSAIDEAIAFSRNLDKRIREIREINPAIKAGMEALDRSRADQPRGINPLARLDPPMLHGSHAIYATDPIVPDDGPTAA
jgi:hypothetical protein